MTSNVMIVCNLKMHPVSKIIETYALMLSNEPIGLLLPYPYLSAAIEKFSESQIWIGAQGVSEHDIGAYTSQISGKMLSEIGVETVLIGHSEVRALGVDVAAQLSIAKSCGFHVIYCIGEVSETFNSGELLSQLSILPPMNNLTIAYEPVWCIGTGRLPSYDEINRCVKLIRTWLSRNYTGNHQSIRVLYGGSIDNKNCKAVLSHTDIDGFLIGGASLDPRRILEVVERCK